MLHCSAVQMHDTRRGAGQGRAGDRVGRMGALCMNACMLLAVGCVYCCRRCSVVQEWGGNLAE